MGFDIDDDVTGNGARPMSVEDERVVRDEAPVPNSLAELAAQPRPMPPPLPPSKPRREPAGSFIRTRVSKKEKQADKRNQFVHSLATAAATRHANASMLTDDNAAVAADDAPTQPSGTETLVDDFLNAVTELSSSSTNTVSVAPSNATAIAAKARTITQRARIELAEQAHFKAVLQHGAFKSDPLGALQEHLANRIKLEREQRERNAASLDALAAHDAQASRRLKRAVKHNRRNNK
jgi:hypothetical protein